MLYNSTNTTTMQGFLQYTQSVAPISEIILITIFIVSFISLKRYETGNAFPPAAFATMISALLLNQLGMLNSMWVSATAALFGISVLILFFRN